MIEISKKRFPKIQFYKKNILEDQLLVADYYICSGAINLLSKNLCYKFIENCFQNSQKGFVFNFLKNKSFNNLKIEEVISYCSSLTSKIKTKNHYLDNDFTIFMLK